jgi:hypothetical protein
MPKFVCSARESEKRRLENPPSIAPGYVLRASSSPVPEWLTQESPIVALGQPSAIIALPSLLYEDPTFSVDGSRR